KAFHSALPSRARLTDEGKGDHYEGERVKWTGKALMQLGTKMTRPVAGIRVIWIGPGEIAEVALAWLQHDSLTLRLEAIEIDGITLEGDDLWRFVVVGLPDDVAVEHDEKGRLVLLHEHATIKMTRPVAGIRVIWIGPGEIAEVALAWLQHDSLTLRLEAIEIDGITLEGDDLWRFVVVGLPDDVAVEHDEKGRLVLLHEHATI